ncbi:restriction endonuclease subunit S [Helicobacter pylori]|uniref:restriction endonuclease subunit S n=1 Tax=Helicobacter pylori TaxID=210 RepID=UPI001923D684|nr:restriction endonuclease subunit S [Helicobacter pylori]QQW94956.1 restriction endonuclease subunit S [Helicobacter pylori]
MHKIERLLQTLAPKGVEFRKLGEVCDFQKGKSITKKAVTFGKVPVISGGRQPAYYHNEANRSGETIAISSSGVYAGYVSYWDIPVFLADSFSVSPKQKTLMPKYLFHYLTMQQDAIHATKSTGGIPHVYSKDLQNFLIPIPPLEIQQEIVKILDAFTELNTELNTELKARKKQYQYYQNMLLDFKGIHSNHKDAKISAKTYPKRLKTLLQTLAPKGVEFRKLGEVCEIIRGKRVTKKEILDKGKYPVVSGGIGFMGYLNEYNREENTITIAQYGTAGFVNWQNKKFWANDVCFSVIPKETLINRYLYYVLTNMQNYLYSISNRSAIPYSISSNNIMQITIPIPPLEIQQEIVKILDQFLALTTDLLAGIPAEIEARKKQYEYYREKLLTFKPLTPPQRS